MTRPSSPSDPQDPHRDSGGADRGDGNDGLDRLLGAAKWPEMPADANRRLEQIWNDVSPVQSEAAPVEVKPDAEAAPTPWGRRVVIAASFAAAVALLGPCSLLFTSSPEDEVVIDPPVEQLPKPAPTEDAVNEPGRNIEPDPRQAIPRDQRVAVNELPGRPAKPFERQMLTALRDRQVSAASDDELPRDDVAPPVELSPTQRVERAIDNVARGGVSIAAARALQDLDPRTLDELLIAPLMNSEATPVSQGASIALLNHLATSATIL
ncbi:MAG: hypothetical protein AAGK78_15365, partial [Planctomycetota bacterium]